jgi:flagellar protein FliS
MSYSHQAVAYRQREVQSATPARLTVMVYDYALANLLRAKRAVQIGNIEERVAATSKAHDAIMELISVLDIERGGQIARNLKSLYAFLLVELVDVGHRRDGGKIDTVIQIVTDLRGAFDAAAVATARVPAA